MRAPATPRPPRCARMGVHVYVDGACIFCGRPPALPPLPDADPLDAALAEFVERLTDADTQR